jgi:signal peptidase I
LVVAAVAVIVAVFILPVLQISGTSMTETLDDGDIVIAINTKKYETGDVIAFYFNNNILIKRVIATAGDWVDIDEEGNVFVNGKQLDEPYVSEKTRGDVNITFPYQVPEKRFFVMGDHRETSVDSRNSAIGCISTDMMVGKLLLRVWPLNKINFVS